ncbi:ROK family protein [Roseomonas elaeocarpi]|uniref:ROK family protein n=1 Tax=Roseomonas elaeocarpi TaxID=907779 RepID=A0ABV6JQ43_9PROT
MPRWRHQLGAVARGVSRDTRSMHPSIVRQIHASRIFHVIRLNPLLSQRELVRQSGFDKSTVSTIVQQFEARGLVERERGSGDGRPGRPGERIRLSERSGLLVGVNLRPGSIHLGAARLDGTLLAERQAGLCQPEQLGATVQAAIEAMLTEVGRGMEEVLAVGVALPGLLSRAGHLPQSPNLGWRDVPLREILTRAVTRPVFLDNNTNAAALAEYLFGSAVEFPDFVYLESGSGVGAGIFLDGEVFRGASGFGGEIGHHKIVPGGRLCRCGASGCLSAYVSVDSIRERLARRGHGEVDLAGLELRARQNDPAVLDVLTEAGQFLGAGLANIINIFNPPLVVLGGGLSRLHPWMRPAMEAAIARDALAAAREDCRIDLAALSASTGSWGGVALALEGCTRFDAAEAVPW